MHAHTVYKIEHRYLIMGEMTLYSFERYPDKLLQHLLN